MDIEIRIARDLCFLNNRSLRSFERAIKWRPAFTRVASEASAVYSLVNWERSERSEFPLLIGRVANAAVVLIVIQNFYLKVALH